MVQAARRDTKNIIDRFAQHYDNQQNRLALSWLIKSTKKQIRNQAVLGAVCSGEPKYIQKITTIYQLLTDTYNVSASGNNGQLQAAIKNNNVANAKQLYEMITGIKLADQIQSDSN